MFFIVFSQKYTYRYNLTVSRCFYTANPYPELVEGLWAHITDLWNNKTAKLVAESGANILVSGSYVLGAEDAKSAISSLKNCL